MSKTTEIVEETVIEEKKDFKQTILKNKMIRAKALDNNKRKNIYRYPRAMRDLITGLHIALWLQTVDELQQKISNNN